MNNKFSLSLVCSALLLAGCGDNTESSGASTEQPYNNQAINEMLSRSSNIDFTLQGEDASVPLPSFLLLDTSDSTLNIPVGYGDSQGLDNPQVAMGEADGWSSQMPFVIDLNLPSGVSLLNDLAPASSARSAVPFSLNLNTGVRVAKVTVDLATREMSNFEALTAGEDFLVVPSEDLRSFNIVPLKGLEPGSDYIYALTDSIKDSNGEPLGTSSSYAILKTDEIIQSGTLAAPQKIIQNVEKAFADNGQVTSTDDIIYSSWFTTSSAGQVLLGTKAAIAQTALPNVAPSNIWNGSVANPNGIDAATLDALYQVTVTSKTSFADAVASDAMFISEFGQQSADLLQGGYNLNFANEAIASIQVVKGTIKLPYFLSDSLEGDAWKKTPWRSAMPSVFKILSVLSSGTEDDKAAVGQQLAVLGLTNLPADLYLQDKLKALIGQTLTLADGTRLDSDRIMTKYSAVPQIRAVKDVPFLMFVPEGAAISANLPILQYQHGITSIKESAYAFAMQHIGGAMQGEAPFKPYAIIAIDQPLHGQRALSYGNDDEVVTDTDNPTVYMNLEYLPVARDNIRQSAIDGLGVRYALNGANDAAFANLDAENVSLFGHSIGAITGISSYAIANTPVSALEGNLFKYTSATLANAGGGIAPFLLNSGSFSPVIKHTIAVKAVPGYASYYERTCGSKDDGVCITKFLGDPNDESANPAEGSASDIAKVNATLASFTFAAQTVLDNVDPYNIAPLVNQTGAPVLGLQAENDSTIPNSVSGAPTAGTEPLFSKLELVNTATDTQGQKLASYFLATTDAEHSTVIAPQSDTDGNANTEMTSQIVQFTLTAGNATSSIAVTDALLDATK
ncbi:extracellular lipase [Vibrio sinaloensis DSM 21326]|uniref:Extracellular lipase n=1 Tax=Vibrio sinaloensis DSM 21326 TaxID=945550 RepID=E8MAD6_PHOS4|nr:VolA/Pla-1 family phospholipase [Vibrio sinaloensis]EGA69085.1 extracellular lipase [Vibrio sinaloensis DSM 21326]